MLIDLKASLRVEADGTRIWDGMAWDITANKRIESLGESRLLLRELAAHHEAYANAKRRISPARFTMSWGRR